MRTTTISLPEELHKRLKLAAVEDDTTARELIRQAVKEYLDRRGRKRRGRTRR